MRNSNVSSRVQCPNYEEEIFRDVETFCMFLGYPRSGHSIVGAFIDAHPDAVISHELNVLEFLQAGFTKRQIFSIILSKSEKFAKKGRVGVRYTYMVPNQWHGRFSKLRVIGDKKGGGSSARIKGDVTLIDRLQKTVGTTVKFIHVIRNPYDTISTMSTRSGKELKFVINRFFSLCHVVMNIKKKVVQSSILDIRHESLIADPKSELTKICLFLGLEPFEAYLSDCASILYSAPHKSRYKVQWTDELVRTVEEKMAGIPFLEGYSFKE
jgi:hypothetical protein